MKCDTTIILSAAGNLSCDRDLLKMPFVDPNFPEIVAFQPIGNDHRRSCNGIAKAVLCRGLQMIDCIGAASSVKRIGIGEKGHGSLSPDLICDRPDEDRIYIRVVSPLAEVDLDCRQVPFMHRLVQAGGIEETLDLVLLVLLVASRPDAGKINFALQFWPTSIN